MRLHDLRHSFASALVNSGRSLYEVQTLLGHSSLKMTQRYANVKITAVEETLGTVFNAVKQGNNPIDDKLEKLKSLFPEKTEEELLVILNVLKNDF